MPRMARLPAQSIALMPSIKAVRGLCTSRKANSSTSARPHTGRLIQYAHRHETRCVRAPPIRGPMAPASAHMNSSKPKYKLRCRTLNKSEIVTSTSCISPPPATPWNARPTIIIVMSTASAQMIDETKKSAAVPRRIGLRPQMSDRLTQMFDPAALASRYAPPIQT